MVKLKKISTAFFMALIIATASIIIFTGRAISKPEIELYLNGDDVYFREDMINIYGLSQRAMGKQAIDNFSIFKNKDGCLVRPNIRLQEEDVEQKTDMIIPICRYCENRGIDYLYVTSILPINSSEELPFKELDYSSDNSKLLLEVIARRKMEVFNIRNQINTDFINHKRFFYITDHHWTTDTMFCSFELILEEFNKRFGFSYDSEITDKEYYEEIIYPNSFLGSYGIKVGKYYAGEDDFIVYKPKCNNMFSFESYDEKGICSLKKEGLWFDCLLNHDMLEDNGFHNKYAAWGNRGSIEHRIINQSNEEGKKLLLIAHSYGMPLSSYFALCFKEVRKLDPQKGRFSGNYLDYIDEYKPDIVLFLVEFEGEIIGEYKTER